MAKVKPTTPTRHRVGKQKPLKKKVKAPSPAQRVRKERSDAEYALHCATPSMRSSIQMIKDNDAKPINRAARNIVKKSKHIQQHD